MGIKRWLGLSILGVLIFAHGLILLANLRLENYTGGIDNFTNVLVSYTNRVFAWAVSNRVSIPFLYTFMLVGGLLLAAFGIWGCMRSILNAVTPGNRDSLVDIVYQQRSLSRGFKIVTIGGGTGLSTLLRGLKDYTNNIVAVVTVSDDGGSSGRLRKELGVLPPGDIRNCLVALADSEILGELLQYRFSEGDGLEGHSFGNLFLVAMTGISGDFLQAIKASSGVLAIRGKVLPATSESLTLCAELEDGTLIEGESEVSRHGKQIKRLFSKPHRPQPLEEVIQAIKEADAIVFGPGSLYTSIMPNLLISRMVEAIRNAQGVKIFICNCMTQPGETDGYAASNHLKVFTKQFGPNLIEFALVNTLAPGHKLRAKYKETGAQFVEPDLDEIRGMGISPVPLPLISETDLVRHDSKRLAEAVMKVMMEGLTRVNKQSAEKPREGTEEDATNTGSGPAALNS